MKRNIKIRRFFEVKILVENESDTLANGLKQAKKAVEMMGLKVHEIRPVKSTRTITQNSSLHLFFTQLAEELNNHGMDMRKLIRQEVEISWTAYSVKEYLWKPLQRVLIGAKSTTQLDKISDINLVYDNLNRIISERTKGEIKFPSFPSLDVLMDK